MNSSFSKVTVHMAASLDFFIAKQDGTVAWMEMSDTYAKGVDNVTAEDAEKFLKTIDCYVIGSSAARCSPKSSFN